VPRSSVSSVTGLAFRAVLVETEPNGRSRLQAVADLGGSESVVSAGADNAGSHHDHRGKHSKVLTHGNLPMCEISSEVDETGCCGSAEQSWGPGSYQSRRHQRVGGDASRSRTPSTAPDHRSGQQESADASSALAARFEQQSRCGRVSPSAAGFGACHPALPTSASIERFGRRSGFIKCTCGRGLISCRRLR